MKKPIGIFTLLISFLIVHAQNEPLLVLDNVQAYQIEQTSNFELYKLFDKKYLNKVNPSIIKAFEAINAKKFGEANTLFNDYLGKPGDDKNLNFICWFFKGYALSQDKIWKDASLCFAKALKIDPLNGMAAWNYGVVNYKLTNWKESIAGFSKAIEINPQFADAYAARARALYFAGLLNKSIQDYFTALRIHPQTDVYVYMLGLTMLYRGNTVYNGDDTSIGSYYMYLAQQSQALKKLLALGENMLSVRSF